MKAKDIALALQARIPDLTDDFSEAVDILSITVSGTTATVTTTAAHNLTTGDTTNILNVVTPVNVTSITRVTTVATVVTSEDHDFTLSDREKAKNIDKQVIISGANEAEFNGSFKMTNVLSRQKIEIEVADSGAASSTGSPIIKNGIASQFGLNGFYFVTVTSATVFSYTLSKALSVNGVVNSESKAVNDNRVARAATLERAVRAYTAKGFDKDFLFVVLGDVVANKGRNTQTDANFTQVGADFYRQQMTQQCAVYLFHNSTNSVAQGKSRDKAEDIASLIFKSLLLDKFDTGFTVDERSALTFVSHGFIDQELNPSIYVHEYIFEQNAELYIDDTIGTPDDVAFRDVDMLFSTQTGNEDFTTSVDLDEEPL